MVFEQRRLFRRPFGGGCVVSRAQRIAQFLRLLEQFAFEDALDVFVEFFLAISVDLRSAGFDLGGPRAIGVGVERHQSTVRHTPVFPVVSRLEDRSETVVIDLRDRLVAMVVALRASEAETQQRRRDRLDRLGHDSIPRDVLIGRTRRRPIWSHAQETCRRQLVEILRREIRVRQRHEFVAGKLLNEELIERLVVVEGANDVVAVLEGPRAHRVFIGVAIRVGVARDIEPVPAPTLAVVRRREQPIDQPLEGVGIGIVDEVFNLVRRRRQAEQVKRHAADQRAAVSFGCE